MGAKLTRRRFLRALGTVGAYLTLTNAVGCDLLERTSKLKSLHKPKLTPLRTRKVWPLASGMPVLPKCVWAFRSRPDLGPAAVEVTKRVYGTAPGYVFVALKEGAGEHGPMIIDDQGELVWFSKHTTARDFKVQYYRGRPVLTWREGRVVAGHGLGEHVIFDGSYREIAWVRAGNSLRGDLHEFLITPQDTALLTAYATARTDLSPIGGPGRCLHSPCRHAVLGPDRASALYTPIFGEKQLENLNGLHSEVLWVGETGCKAPLSPLCDTKNTRSRLVQLFSKQFRKGNSAKFWRYKTGS